jgi:hypothetical protein
MNPSKKSSLRVELEFEDYEILSEVLRAVDLTPREGVTLAKIEQIIALMKTKRHLQKSGTIPLRQTGEGDGQVEDAAQYRARFAGNR